MNPLDEIVICVFESGERMIRSMFAAAHTIVQRARLTQRRLIIAGLWLGAEFYFWTRRKNWKFEDASACVLAGRCPLMPGRGGGEWTKQM